VGRGILLVGVEYEYDVGRGTLLVRVEYES
jgi:hypothetical protein